MNRSHEHVLADIEQQVQESGVAPDDVDAAIADVLGVPADYYFAYLLVWGAIEAHRQAATVANERHYLTTAEPALDLAASLTDEIGRLASSLHEGTDGRSRPQDVARILGCVLQLRQLLRDLHPRPRQPSQPGDDTVEVAGRG